MILYKMLHLWWSHEYFHRHKSKISTPSNVNTRLSLSNVKQLSRQWVEYNCITPVIKQHNLTQLFCQQMELHAIIHLWPITDKLFDWVLCCWLSTNITVMHLTTRNWNNCSPLHIIIPCIKLYCFAVQEQHYAFCLSPHIIRHTSLTVVGTFQKVWNTQWNDGIQI